MTPEQAVTAVIDSMDRTHRERRQSAADACQRLDEAVNNARALNRDMAAYVFEAYQAEIARLREVIADMLSFQNDDTECLADPHDDRPEWCADGRCRAHGCMVERVNGWRAVLAKATEATP